MSKGGNQQSSGETKGGTPKRQPQKPEAIKPEEAVAAALNQHGFLFAHAVEQQIRSRTDGHDDASPNWSVVTHEYAVTARDGGQTRIDLLLKNKRKPGSFICIECKRPNPLYKQWVFFGKTCGTVRNEPPSMFFENFVVSARPLTQLNANHGVGKHESAAGCAVYDRYMEAAIDREKKPGHTEAIEDAFRQVTKGVSGMMEKILGFEDLWRVDAFPAVVTTARLFEATFDMKSVSMNSGTIAPENLKLTPLEFCAVNYHADDSLAVESKYSYSITNLAADISLGQTRTVFVVHAEAIDTFLDWMNEKLVPR